jgi:hypothetical protein
VDAPGSKICVRTGRGKPQLHCAPPDFPFRPVALMEHAALLTESRTHGPCRHSRSGKSRYAPVEMTKLRLCNRIFSHGKSALIPQQLCHLDRSAAQWRDLRFPLPVRTQILSVMIFRARNHLSGLQSASAADNGQARPRDIPCPPEFPCWLDSEWAGWASVPGRESRYPAASQGTVAEPDRA